MILCYKVIIILCNEVSRMDEKEKKKLDNLNKRYKKQNEEIAKKYDRVSATLPKGTTERIKALGLSVNGLINKLVLAELERLERDKSSEPPF